MNDDFFRQMTPFDQYLSNQDLQMTKLMIPYLPPQSQRMLALYIKFSELQSAYSHFNYMTAKQENPEDILEHMKPFFSSDIRESFEQMEEMMSMMSMFQEMQKEGETDDGLGKPPFTEGHGSSENGAD